MKLKKFFAFLMLAVFAFAIASCDGSNVKPVEEEEQPYQRSDELIYDNALGEYYRLAMEAKEIADDDERYVKYAEAEAEFIASAVAMPYSTQGGLYAVTRVAPRTIPYVMWGNNDDILKGIVAVTGDHVFIKSEERAEMLALWQAAREGGAAYNPAAYLAGKGYTLATEYRTTFSTGPVTLDIVNTSSQSDTEILVNVIEGLFEYNNLGLVEGASAAYKGDNKAWTVSEDGLEYRFEIAAGHKWYDATGAAVADVTADDFVAGFQHMLDAKAGLEWLVEGVVEGVEEYLAKEASTVSGVYADGNEVVFRLCQPESFFPSRLTYSCFMPMNRDFFLAHGGAFGVDEFAAAKADPAYSYGLKTDVSSMLYNGPFHIAEYTDEATIVLEPNEGYWNAANVTINKITWIFDDGKNPQETWKDVLSGQYAGSSLTETGANTLKESKTEKLAGSEDTLFDACRYITDTTSTSYLLGVNLKRQTFGLANGQGKSVQTYAEKVAIYEAMQNVHFRRAILRAFDRVSWNAVTRGEDTAAYNLRNCYTAPEFVSIAKNVTASDGHEFIQGTSYGDLVQYFIDKKADELGALNVADGQDGWYNKDLALAELAQARKEVKGLPEHITLEIVCYGSSTSQVAQAMAFKKVIEENTDGQILINIIMTSTVADFYALGYRASNGAALGQDLFYGSGWGPDYADPSTYLDTFLPDGAGYMTKVIGLF
jgi:peptide/nickel transport system substrate-binding protein/oligopeptide transport system substrate-binding protein